MNKKSFVRNNRPAFIAFLLGIFGLVSCDKQIYDDLQPCGMDICFVYDYNMKFADAFSHEVKKVDLFIFDEQGKFVKAIGVENNNFPKDYKMHIELPLGKYQMISWAGLYNNSYNFVNLTVGTSTIEDLKVQIKTANGLQDKELDALWHGEIKEITVSGKPNQTYTISLVKDTNKFRFTLLTSDKKNPIDINKYDFEIIADNGRYDAHNSPIKDNVVRYSPYYRANSDNISEGGVNYAAAIAEVNTGRLMADRENRLHIRVKETGKLILDVNLNDFLAVLKLQAYSKMPMQEYLDREDVYSITFFFTEGTTPEADLISVKIMINGWLIREHGSNL